MKSLFKLLVILLLILVIFCTWMFWPTRLDSSATATPLLPKLTGQVKVSHIETGYIKSVHALNVRGGQWHDYHSSMMAVLLEHPNGKKYLIDSGFGSKVASHFQTTPALMQAVSELTVLSNTKQELLKRGVQPSQLSGIILTHAHWDHVSGIDDLRQVPIMLAQEELEFINSGNENVALIAAWANGLTFQTIPFTPQTNQYASASYDLFGDGSVWLLKTPGHTPGSISILIKTAHDKDILLVGDTSWTKEGITWPATKPWLASVLADNHPDMVADQLKQLNKLQQAHPQLTIIPAHDGRLAKAIQ